MSSLGPRYVTQIYLKPYNLYGSQFKIDAHALDICGVQGRSFLKDDRRDPRQGQRVIVTKGSRKGYTGRVRYIGVVAVTIELDALVTGSQSPYQDYQWSDLMPL